MQSIYISLCLIFSFARGLRTNPSSSGYSVAEEWTSAPTKPFAGFRNPTTGRLSSCPQTGNINVQSCANAIRNRLLQIYDRTLTRTPAILDAAFPYFTVGFRKRLQFLRARFEAMNALLQGEPVIAQDMFKRMYGVNSTESLLAKASAFDARRDDLTSEGESMRNRAKLDMDAVAASFDETDQASNEFTSKYDQAWKPLVESTVTAATGQVQIVLDSLRESFKSARDGRVKNQLLDAVASATNDANAFANIVETHKNDSRRVHKEKDEAIKSLADTISLAVGALAGNIESKYTAQRARASEQILKNLIYDPIEQNQESRHSDAMKVLQSDVAQSVASLNSLRSSHVQQIANVSVDLGHTVRNGQQAAVDFSRIVKKNLSALSTELSANTTRIRSAQIAHFAAVNATIVHLSQALEALDQALRGSQSTQKSTAQQVMTKLDVMTKAVLSELAAMISSSSGAIFESLNVQQNAMLTTLRKLGYTVTENGGLARSAGASAMMTATETTKKKFAQLGELLKLLVDSKAYMEEIIHSSSRTVGEDVDRLNAVLTAGATDLSMTLSDVTQQQRIVTLEAKAKAMGIVQDSLDKVGAKTWDVKEKINEVSNLNQATFVTTAEKISQGVNDTTAQVQQASAGIQAVAQSTKDASSLTRENAETAFLSAKDLKKLFSDFVDAANLAMNSAIPDALRALKMQETASIASINQTQQSALATLNSAVSAFRSRLSNSQLLTGNLATTASGLIFKGEDGFRKIATDIEAIVAAFESQTQNVLNELAVNKSRALSRWEQIVYNQTEGQHSLLSAWKQRLVDFQTDKLDTFKTTVSSGLHESIHEMFKILQQAFNETSSVDRLIEVVSLFTDGQGDFGSDAAHTLVKEAERIRLAGTESELNSQYSMAMLLTVLKSAEDKFQTLLEVVPSLKQNFTDLKRSSLSKAEGLVSDIHAIGAYGSDFGHQIARLNEAARSTELQNTNTRVASLNHVLSETHIAENKALTDILTTTRNNAVKLYGLLEVLDLVRTAQIHDLQSHDSGNLILATRLRQSQSAMSDISESVAGYFGANDASLASKADINQQQIAQEANRTVDSQVMSARSAGDIIVQLLSLLDDIKVDNFDDKAGLLNIAKEIRKLGGIEAENMRQLLREINAGEKTLLAVIDDISRNRSDSVETLSEAAGLLVKLMGHLDSKLALAISNAREPLVSFHETFAEISGNLTRTALAAGHEMQVVADTVGASSSAYTGFADRAILESSESLTKLRNESLTREDETILTSAKVQDAFTRASNKVAALRQQEASEIKAEINATVNAIRNFFHSQNLAIDKVVWTE